MIARPTVLAAAVDAYRLVPVRTRSETPSFRQDRQSPPGGAPVFAARARAPLPRAAA